MFDVSAAALAAEAAPYGLASVCVVETPGLFGRPDVSWTRVVLQGS